MKWLKYIGYFILSLIALAGISYWMLNSAEPEGLQNEQKVSTLKDKMFSALSKDAWDETRWIQWSFPGGHDYLWDRERHLVEVKYKDYTVLLNPNTVDGQASRNGERLEGKESKKQIDKAFGYFTNDAFWLAAPFMIDQDGTELSIAQTENGREGILVEYTTGGVTPGDKYLWILGPDGKPNAYQMWVEIIPVGGTEASWEDWVQLKSGAWIAQSHKIGPAPLNLSNIRDGESYRDFGRSSDPFAAIVKKK